MKVIIAQDYRDLSDRAAWLVVEQIKAKPDSVLALPTGKTPLGMYRNLIDAYQRGEISFAQVSAFNLDEYVGIPRLCRDSFYTYMKEHLFDQVDISPANIYVLDGNATNLEDECANYERQIEDLGELDMAVLGLGLDGHIAFCEPGTDFNSETTVVSLTESTRQANRVDLLDLPQVPEQALTMGLGTIMKARQIILLVSGEAKAEILAQALEGPVTEELPASILQNHPALTVITDKEAATKLKSQV